MAQSPEELRQEIEQTRAEMSRDVDAISDKVSPSRIVNRRIDRTKSAVGGFRERLMGSASSGASSLGDKASSASSSVSDAVSSAPDTVMSRTEGNPLAAGLIAFAAGVIAAGLLPATRAETEAARTVEDKVKEPLKEGLGGVAQEMKGNLQESAQEAAQSVKETTTQAAQTVADEGKEAAQNVSETGKQSADAVRSDAQSAADDVRSSSS